MVPVAVTSILAVTVTIATVSALSTAQIKQRASVLTIFSYLITFLCINFSSENYKNWGCNYSFN
jgi:hypothetical protein